MNIYYHTLVLEYDSHVVVKELLELLIAEVDAELLKPNVINFIINFIIILMQICSNPLNVKISKPAMSRTPMNTAFF